MRLFFALPCPPRAAAGIDAWRSGLALGGQPVSAANLHVTLAFLGTQPSSKLPQLEQLAASVEASAFVLQLDQLRCWSGGLLLLAPGKTPLPLLSLASQLQQKLHAAGFELEQREYLPHLTLARKCTTLISAVPPVITWQVDAFTLFRSQMQPDGVHYEALKSWKLLPSD